MTDREDPSMPTPPRDPRLRRALAAAGTGRVDALDAAVRLEVGMAAMRAQHLDRGPDAEPVNLDRYRGLNPDAVAAAQLGTTEPRLTAQEFADALATDDVEDYRDSEGRPPGHPAYCGEGCIHVEDVPAVTPPWDDARADEAALGAFSSERSRPALTWRSRHDEASRAFGVRQRLAVSAPVQDRQWATGPVLDQGAEGECVGMAVAAAANVLYLAGAISRPGPVTFAGAEHLYREAQRLDEVPGEDYTGTSVLAGMKAGVAAGLFGGYLWAFGTKDVAQAVLQRGPVVVGVPWLSGMYETGPGGLVRLEGTDEGLGHCLTIVGIRRQGPAGATPGAHFVWQNSWGPGYGVDGFGLIHHRDLALLLRGRGEAAIPTREAQAPA